MELIMILDYLPYFFIFFTLINVSISIIFTYYMKKNSKDIFLNENILLITAHPDDESMFFLPTLLSLKNIRNFYLLCLSNGNGSGLGKIREKELLNASKYLGIKYTEIIDREEFRDSMEAFWDDILIEKIIKENLEKFKINSIS